MERKDTLQICILAAYLCTISGLCVISLKKVIIPVNAVYLTRQADEKQTALPKSFKKPDELPIAPTLSSTKARAITHKELTITDIVILRRLLEDKNFEELNIRLDMYRQAFRQDQTKDTLLFSAYQALSTPLAEYEELHQAWIAAYPDILHPRLVLADFYKNMAWKARDSQDTKETPTQQFAKRLKLLDKSLIACHHALRIAPGNIYGLNLLIIIHNANGNEVSKNTYITKALHLYPTSFELRSTILWTKQPRWGGSIKEMAIFAAQAEKYLVINQKLRFLHAMVLSEKAFLYQERHKPERAAVLYAKSLEYGDCWQTNHQLAKFYFYTTKQYDLALQYIDKAIELREDICSAHILRSKILFYMEKYEEAYFEVSMAQQISPGSPSLEKWKKNGAGEYVIFAYRQYKAGNFHMAMYLYNLAEKMNPYWEVFHYRALTAWKLKNFDMALDNLHKAVSLKPDNFESYRILDYLLTEKKRWPEIIENWDNFLTLYPQHAEAYFQRSGAYYHQGSLTRAKNDLDQACRLGNNDACQQKNKWEGD